MTSYIYKNFENSVAFLKMKFLSNRVTMTTSYIPALFSKHCFKILLQPGFLKVFLFENFYVRSYSYSNIVYSYIITRWLYEHLY